MINSAKTSQKGKIREKLNEKGARVYFIGIGGVSMSSLALLMKKRGFRVAGSDIRKSEITDMLTRCGVSVKISHSKESIMAFRPDIVVYSLAVDSANPEYKVSVDMNILTVSRAELLGTLMEDFKTKIGVSGSHGKSTVTAMLGSVFCEIGCYPTVLCGAEISEEYGLVAGKEDYLIYEACEYGDSFLKLPADIQILLNLELDHTDYFKSKEAISESFLRCANNSRVACVLNYDCPNLRAIADKITVKTHAFSKNYDTEYRYEALNIGMASYSFKLYKAGELLGEYFPGVRGEFNVANSVAVAISSHVAGISYEASARAIKTFRGIKRRLELINQNATLDVFYDYAHHPSEISAVWGALSEMGYKNMSVIFAPHTYSRTRSFFDEFVKSLAKFNTVYVTDIYGARESALVGVNSTALADAIRNAGGRAYAVCQREICELSVKIKEENPDCLVLMGAGELEKYKEEFMKK